MEKQTLVWAHRGASGYAPENTLEAFQKAVEMGADGVELDVQLTKDGELVVIHDETVDRTSDGSGWVKDFTYARISRFNYNRTHKEGYERAMIPTLEEVYELLKPTGLIINVELKTGVVFYPEIEERVLDLTARMGLEERVWYSSFNHYTVQRIKELNPQAKTGMLYCDGMSIPSATARSSWARTPCIRRSTICSTRITWKTVKSTESVCMSGRSTRSSTCAWCARCRWTP